MAPVDALNAGDITRIGVIITVALVLIGILLSIVITKLIGRVILIVLVVAAGIFVWQQRAHIEDSFSTDKCKLNATFFGIHLDAPQSVQDACNATTN